MTFNMAVEFLLGGVVTLAGGDAPSAEIHNVGADAVPANGTEQSNHPAIVMVTCEDYGQAISLPSYR